MSQLFPSGTSPRTAQRILTEQLRVLYGYDEAKSLAWQAIEHVVGVARIHILTRQPLPLSPGQATQLEAVAARLLQHEPIQYIRGNTEFLGLELQVRPGVLIPRPETEELAHYIVGRHKQAKGLKVLDIGTGSGCIALALAANLPGAEVHAADISAQALQVASANARQLGLAVQFFQIDILQAQGPELPSELDIIVSNPPYVLQSEEVEMLPNVLRHEPHGALFVPDNDPLLFYNAILKLAFQRLAPGGILYFETNRLFAADIATMALSTGFKKARAMPDMFGNPRFVEAQR